MWYAVIIFYSIEIFVTLQTRSQMIVLLCSAFFMKLNDEIFFHNSTFYLILSVLVLCLKFNDFLLNILYKVLWLFLDVIIDANEKWQNYPRDGNISTWIFWKFDIFVFEENELENLKNFPVNLRIFNGFWIFKFLTVF